MLSPNALAELCGAAYIPAAFSAAGDFYVGHCRGADSRARRSTYDLHRLPVKTYQPIASVAALPERLWQLQLPGKYRRPCNVPKFVIARPQRGRVISQYPVGSHRKAPAKSQLPPRDCTPRALPRASRSGRHVASLLAMTHQGGAAVGTVHSAELALLLPLRGLAGRALLLQWRTVIAVSASSGRTGRCRTTRRRSGQRERGSWRPC